MAPNKEKQYSLGELVGGGTHRGTPGGLVRDTTLVYLHSFWVTKLIKLDIAALSFTAYGP